MAGNGHVAVNGHHVADNGHHVALPLIKLTIEAGGRSGTVAGTVAPPLLMLTTG